MAAKFVKTEQLIESVRKLLCLYDTSRKEYKDEMLPILTTNRRATRNFRGQGSRRQKGHNKKFCVKGISLRLCSLDLETEEIFEAFS